MTPDQLTCEINQLQLLDATEYFLATLAERDVGLVFFLGGKMKTVATLLLAVLMATGGVLLAQYAEADDAPGGVVMGWALVIGAVALGARELIHRKAA